MAMVQVLAVITTEPGKREDVLKLFKANVPNVLVEQGCIEYGPTIDAEGVEEFQTPYGPDTFVVIEKWESLDHLMTHSAAPHMKAYAESVTGMIADRQIHVMSAA